MKLTFSGKTLFTLCWYKLHFHRIILLLQKSIHQKSSRNWKSKQSLYPIWQNINSQKNIIFPKLTLLPDVANLDRSGWLEVPGPCDEKAGPPILFFWKSHLCLPKSPIFAWLKWNRHFSWKMSLLNFAGI